MEVEISRMMCDPIPTTCVTQNLEFGRITKKYQLVDFLVVPCQCPRGKGNTEELSPVSFYVQLS